MWYQQRLQGNRFPWSWLWLSSLALYKLFCQGLGFPPQGPCCCALWYSSRWENREHSGAGRRIPAEATTSKHEVSRPHDVGVKQTETEGNFFSSKHFSRHRRCEKEVTQDSLSLFTQIYPLPVDKQPTHSGSMWLTNIYIFKDASRQRLGTGNNIFTKENT